VKAVPPSGQNAAFETECVLFFAEVMQVFGVPKSVGQIYGLLYASPEPLSFSDIVVRLEISKGSASQGLQLLRTLGAINVARSWPRHSSKGDGGSVPRSPQSATLAAAKRSANGSEANASRRDYYEPELGLRKLISGVLRERFEPLVGTGADRFARLRRVAEENRETRDFCLQRVKQLETWRTQLRLTLPVVRTFLGPGNT
jgi:hypothetical protein